MYPAAIEGFRSANPIHKRRAEEYTIQRAGDWDDVYAILEHARDKYRDDGGAVGWFRKIRRKAADNVDTVQVVSSQQCVVADISMGRQRSKQRQCLSRSPRLSTETDSKT